MGKTSKIDTAWDLMVRQMADGPVVYNADRIGDIMERLEAANPGPWEVETKGDWSNLLVASCGVGSEGNVPYDVIVGPDHEGNGTLAKEDAEFIAHSPADVMYLLKLVQQLQAQAVTA